MKLNSYKSGDEVEVKILNPQTNKTEWRNAKVIGIQTTYPNINRGERHKPYLMVIISVHRTYVKGTPIYRYLKGQVKRMKIFVENRLTYYTKINTEGILNEKEIRLKTNEKPKWIKSPANCPYCEGNNTRLDFDYPETMSSCDDCGCDFITKTGEILLHPNVVS